MAQAFEDRPWIWASHVWNMFDFGCAARNEGGVAGRNNKGLVTIDRKTRKDSFYLYQAYWTKDPMVHINGRRYAQRAGETTEVKVYSNQDCVTLYLNGQGTWTQQATACSTLPWRWPRTLTPCWPWPVPPRIHHAGKGRERARLLHPAGVQ